ncbi:hypothetical protein BGZ70_009489 [Mortierella alpina]|uniref:Carrier domain-containing protein n=1 Tax=Mortierella alpina TaxID=64518 RepID=A0A9P6M0A8_MORAP|nr:hypothetical protein BGZ70_009489 [Mortierella alpina]
MLRSAVSGASIGPVVEHPAHKGLDATFRHQADERCTAVAVIYGPQALSYTELDQRANLLATHLTLLDIRYEEPIGILLRMSPDQIICQLAIIRAGGTCVPLDLDAPDERIHGMLDDVGTRFVLTSAAFRSRVPQTACILVEDHRHHQKESPVSRSTTKIEMASSGADHRTHILFTSGTTGRPKGVQLLARGIIRLTVAPRYVSLTSDERIAAISNPTFDASLFEIWGALLNGGTSVLLPKQTVIDPCALRDSLRVQRITTMLITTALFNQTVHACPDVFQGMHQVLIGGEAANILAIRAVFESARPDKLFNIYGPTEGTAFALFHEILLKDLKSETVPIGKPIDNTKVFLLDEARRPVGGNEVGEIYIGGDGVARGYWNRPVQNAACFIDLDGVVEGQSTRLYRTGDLGRRDEQGVLYFHGRNDHQLKIRGHRIEVEEIEAILRASGLVQDAAVIAHQSELGDKYLVGFVVCRKGQATEPGGQRVQERLERYLKERLPIHMHPRIVVLKSLPVTRNGKLDRKALVQHWHDEQARKRKSELNDQTTNARIQPGVRGTQALLSDMWRRLLDTESVTRDDNFFSLGGNSLTASRLATDYIDNRFQEPNGFSSVDDLSVLVADVGLPADIRQLPGELQGWTAPGRGRVFMTGATGFLAAFLLRDLLATLKSTANNDEALDRIRQNMCLYGLWDVQFPIRLLPLAGDLSHEYFGLEPSRFDELSMSSDVVFHLGAHVNYIQPYTAHRPANVTGTINVLKFVTSGNPKSLHYVSSISAFGPVNLLKRTETVYEDADMKAYLTGLKYDTGYSQSQWVAEQLVWEARRRGIPLSVYRPGFIMGDSRTGAGNPKDFMARFIKGCIELGSYPILPSQGKQIVAVDYVSQALLRIASDDSNLWRAYHVVPSRNEELGKLFDLLAQCGSPLRALPYPQWVQCLNTSSDINNSPLMPFISMLMEPVYGHLTRWEVQEGMPSYDMSNTRRVLDASGGLKMPPIDQALLQKYINFWTRVDGQPQKTN